jgi:hypothetical protein
MICGSCGDPACAASAGAQQPSPLRGASLAQRQVGEVVVLPLRNADGEMDRRN